MVSYYRKISRDGLAVRRLVLCQEMGGSTPPPASIIDKGGIIMADSKSRMWACVIYPDDSNFKVYFDLLITNFSRYWFCEHDKDLDENGLLKKSHYHFLVDAQNAISSSAFIRRTHLEHGFEAVRSKRAYIRYLIHADNPDKHQYDKSEICTNALMDIDKALNPELDADEFAILFFDWLESNQNASVKDAYQFALSVNAGKPFRASAYLYINILRGDMQ